MKIILSGLFFFTLLPGIAQAEAEDIRGVAESLGVGMSFLGNTLMMASFVLGTCLLIGGVMLFKQHRVNPKLVPLPTPIIMVILGVGGLCLPYWAKMPNVPRLDVWSTKKVVKEHQRKADERAQQIREQKERQRQHSRTSTHPGEKTPEKEPSHEGSYSGKKRPYSKESEYWAD